MQEEEEENHIANVFFLSFVSLFFRCRYLSRSGCYGDADLNKAWGLPLSEITVADYLSQAGYYNVMFGKWHLGSFQKSFFPTSRGFHHFVGFLGGGGDFFKHTANNAYDWWYDDAIDASVSGTYSEIVLNNSIQNFIYNDGFDKQPWFMYLPLKVCILSPFAFPNFTSSHLSLSLSTFESRCPTVTTPPPLPGNQFMPPTIPELNSARGSLKSPFLTTWSLPSFVSVLKFSSHLFFCPKDGKKIVFNVPLLIGVILGFFMFLFLQKHSRQLDSMKIQFSFTREIMDQIQTIQTTITALDATIRFLAAREIIMKVEFELRASFIRR
jgi:hypothetical protein